MATARYRPSGGVAAGGMGEVAEYEDTHLKRKVVIKRLQLQQEERRIVDEQKALLKLRSKHVVQLFDIQTLHDRGRPEPAIVMEYISGNDLQIGNYTPGETYLKVIWQIACGLSDIHAAKVIHRDIKPNNIRVDNEGVVKIFDFGLARSEFDASTRGAVGTPVFMAPELWGTRTISFSNAIDVYAFGVTCLALLSATVPLELGSHPPRPVVAGSLAEIFGGLPREVAVMIEACIAFRPEDRPSMSEVERVLSRQLLKDRHRALVVMDSQIYHLNAQSRSISVNASSGLRLKIYYNGFDFIVRGVEGDVSFNNQTVQLGDVVPGCCVIAFNRSNSRKFVTFDVSSPEVMA